MKILIYRIFFLNDTNQTKNNVLKIIPDIASAHGNVNANFPSPMNLVTDNKVLTTRTPVWKKRSRESWGFLKFSVSWLVTVRIQVRSLNFGTS